MAKAWRIFPLLGVCSTLLGVARPALRQAPDQCATIHMVGARLPETQVSVGLARIAEGVRTGLGGSLWIGARLPNATVRRLASDSVWLHVRDTTLAFAMQVWNDPPANERVGMQEWRVFGFEKLADLPDASEGKWYHEVLFPGLDDGVLRFRVISDADTGYIHARDCTATTIL